MILAQIDESSKDHEQVAPSASSDLGVPASWIEALTGLAQLTETAAQEGEAVHCVEKAIWVQMLSLGHDILQQFFDRVGNGDLGERMEQPDGRVLRRLPKSHPRPYQSIFGAFELPRAVYGTREGQRVERAPLDERLQLPDGKFSYLLQDWNQQLTVENPYKTVARTLENILGFRQSVDSLERMSRKMAEPVADYWDGLEAPASEEEGALRVLSADGKGVPIRRSVSDMPIERHAPKKGPKPGSKKMALVAASYSVDRNPRTPGDVVESLFRRPGTSKKTTRQPRPLPKHKRMRASLARSESGKTEPATTEIFGWLAKEEEERAAGPFPIVLMDGQPSLWDAAEDFLSEGRTEILDLLHVTPRLWTAAYLFHPKAGADATRFVRERVLRILQGKTRSVITGLRRMGTASGLTGRKRKKLERICGYFENNIDRMRYGDYLAAGYPIATGVIEGACRHLVKDRLERAGMQWVLEGAQAILDLRSVHLSDQWNDFQKYRNKKEQERLYPDRETLKSIQWPLAAA